MSENNVSFGSLGQGDSYAVYTDEFDPSLLNPMPRKVLRERFNIDTKFMGFVFMGFDVWHCYESTFLLNSGLPVSGTLKFIYPASSPNIVESKSMKLYLNSFDMCKMGSTLVEAKNAYVNQIKTDLSKIVESSVDVQFFDSVNWNQNSDNHEDILIDCENIADFGDIYNTEFVDYNAQDNYIRLINKEWRLGYTGYYYTNVLRSRCRHTKQKDTGTAVIWHDTEKNQIIDPISFLRQVVSLREVNEFHELCAEKLFNDVRSKIQKDDNVTIALLYSRRGSLDINPVRTTSLNCIPSSLINVNELTMKTQGQ